MVLGSVAEPMVRRATWPVLTIYTLYPATLLGPSETQDLVTAEGDG